MSGEFSESVDSVVLPTNFMNMVNLANPVNVLNLSELITIIKTFLIMFDMLYDHQ